MEKKRITLELSIETVKRLNKLAALTQDKLATKKQVTITITKAKPGRPVSPEARKKKLEKLHPEGMDWRNNNWHETTEEGRQAFERYKEISRKDFRVKLIPYMQAAYIDYLSKDKVLTKTQIKKPYVSLMQCQNDVITMLLDIAEKDIINELNED